MKKISAAITGVVSLLSALPALALTTGINYGTIIGLGTRDVREVIMVIIQIIMGFLGIIAIIIVLAGGFKWMTAGGNEEKVAEAKKLIIAGVIGLVIVLTAFAIATFVVNSLVNATY